MSHGRYSDDPLEDSLLRDDELRMQEKLDEELRQYELEHGEDKRGSTAAVVSVLHPQSSQTLIFTPKAPVLQFMM